MASSSTSKAPCATCGSKGVGIFKCEGCGQVFCRKHVIEHRDVLSQQLDEIFLEYDTLRQMMAESQDKPNHHDHPLMKQIDKWEKESIDKIRQTANEARQQVNTLIGSSGGTVPNDLHELAERLRKAREDDDYVETDLRTWTTKLEKLKSDVNSFSSSACICEDSTKAFISRIYVAVTKENLAQEERFGEFCGNIRIEDNGCVALFSGFDGCNAYVRGRGEYSNGKHQIRFIMNKKTTEYIMSFNIVSKFAPVLRTSSGEKPIIYGWHTDDRLNNPNKDFQNKKNFKDLRGETSFELQILLDCDNHKISYFNERTKNTHQMNVNIQKCPFPWQLEFYLFDVGDRVQLVSSTQVF